MEVQLTKSQSEMIAKLSPALRDAATKEFLVLNAENAKLRQVTLDRFQQTREVFAQKMGDLGNNILSGLGSRFPLSLYEDQWNTLQANAEAITKFFADNKVEMDKRKAGREVTLKVRKAAERAKKVAVLKAAGIH